MRTRRAAPGRPFEPRQREAQLREQLRGQLVELEIGAVAHGGSCVARLDGRVVFVRHTLPGERVVAQVTDTSHDSYWRADAVRVLRASPDRVDPPCPHAGPPDPDPPDPNPPDPDPGPPDPNPDPGAVGPDPRGLADEIRPRRGCGGCDWQHATLAAQRRLAGQVVAESLRRLTGLEVMVEVEEVPLPDGVVDGCVDAHSRYDDHGHPHNHPRARSDDGDFADGSSPLGGGAPSGDVDGTGWRTRVRFAVTQDGVVGLRQHRSHRVVAAPDCVIAHPMVTAAVAGRRFPGAESVEVVASPTSGSVSVSVSMSMSPAPPAGDAAGDAAPGTESGEDVVEVVRGRRFHLDPSSFWQVHPGAAYTLVEAVLDGLQPRVGEVALDLYAGAGLFAAFLAEAVGPTGQVIAMESDRAGVVSAARSLADLTQVSVRAVRVTEASVRGVLGRDAGAGGRDAGAGRRGLDVAVLDPPRAGAGPDVVGALLAHRPRAVAYVACDPASLGRDLAAAAAAGYELSGLRAFALFPMTSHIECVAILTPRSPRSRR